MIRLSSGGLLIMNKSRYQDDVIHVALEKVQLGYGLRSLVCRFRLGVAR